LAGNLAVEATGFTLELSGAYILSATTPFAGQLLPILSTGNGLTITVGNGIEIFPLPDAEALTTFIAACQAIT
jgi:hypothetical protein